MKLGALNRLVFQLGSKCVFVTENLNVCIDIFEDNLICHSVLLVLFDVLGQALEQDFIELFDLVVLKLLPDFGLFLLLHDFQSDLDMLQRIIRL
jgi:hypothetical protein